jgi:hypothetical protein
MHSYFISDTIIRNAITFHIAHTPNYFNANCISFFLVKTQRALLHKYAKLMSINLIKEAVGMEGALSEAKQ